jgi:hypothetical protein
MAHCWVDNYNLVFHLGDRLAPHSAAPRVIPLVFQRDQECRLQNSRVESTVVCLETTLTVAVKFHRKNDSCREISISSSRFLRRRERL